MSGVDWSKTIKELLVERGYTVEGVRSDGRFLGVRILKDGVPVHKTPYGSLGLAIEIIEAEEA